MLAFDWLWVWRRAGSNGEVDTGRELAGTASRTKVTCSSRRRGRLDLLRCQSPKALKLPCHAAGVLKPVPKEERRAAIAVELAKFGPTRTDLYVPTNPKCRVVQHDRQSGRPMQSAAKVR